MSNSTQVSDDTSAYKAGQYYPQTTIRFDPLFTRGLSPGERELYAFLSFRSWQKKNLVVHAAIPFLATNTAISQASVKRHLKRLFELQLVRCERFDRNKGNDYFVEPLLLARFCWTTLKNLDRSFLFQMVEAGPGGFGSVAERMARAWTAQFDPTKSPEIGQEIARSAQNELSNSSKRADETNPTRMLSAQNELQIYLLYTLLLSDAAMRRKSPSDASAGKSGKKGVLRTGSKGGSKLSKALSEAERLAQLKGQLTLLAESELPEGQCLTGEVVSVVGSNFHA